MSVSIRDVAKAAGVSTATVSRILHNHPLISAETREKTLRVMRELNYVPNSLAAGLSNQKAFSVALLVDIGNERAYRNPFFNEIIHGIETVVYDRDLCLVIANNRTSPTRGDTLAWLACGKRVQGVILPSSMALEAPVRMMTDKRIPFAVLGEPEGLPHSVDWVDIDNRLGGFQAVAHMWEHQYKRPALLNGEKGTLFNRQRRLGYLEGMAHHGIEADPRWMPDGEATKAEGFRMAEFLLGLDNPPDAFICCDNALAVGAMKAVREAGRRIPEEIGVISFDNTPIAEWSDPSMTTVDIDVFELGVQAATFLLDRIGNPDGEPRARLIPTSIVVRESTNRGG